MTKLSQIAAAPAPPALADTLVGVSGGTTDRQYTLTQVFNAPVVQGTSGVTVNTPANIGYNSAGGLGAGTAGFELIGGPNGSGNVPVPTLIPTTPNTLIALDLCPNGVPTDLGYGLCWFDMTSTDQIAHGNVATSSLHIGVHAATIFIGTGQYVAGTVLPLNFGTFNGDSPAETVSFTINTDATVTHKTALRGFVISKAGLPTTGDLAAGQWGVFKDTSGGTVNLAINDGGVIKKVALA